MMLIKNTLPKRTSEQSLPIYQHELSLILPNKVKEIATAQKRIQDKLERILMDKEHGNIYDNLVSYFGDRVGKYEDFLRKVKIENSKRDYGTDDDDGTLGLANSILNRMS